MRICVAISGFSSMLSLTMRTAPLAARTTFSRIGPSCLHGPHHGAQKSTMTGWSNEASTTSAIKLAVVTSWTAAAPAAAPPPIKGSFAMRYAPRGYNANMAAGRRDGKRRRRVSSWRNPIEIDDARLVPAPGEEAQQIGRRDRRGAIVFQRMVVERIVLQHGLVEHDGHQLGGGVVGDGERRHAAGFHAEHLI